MFSDALDSYFKYVKARIIIANSNRLVPGMIEANAWPPEEVHDESFYLLILGENPSNNFGSVSSRGIIHTVQWTWIVIGTDLPQSNVVGRNKGNRYRNNAKMKQELLNGLFPNYCDKNNYVPQQQGNTLVSVPTPVGEKIWWSAPRFLPSKLEDKSGVLYGAAQVFVSEFSDLIIQ
jgi:hypothetical protein